MSRDSFGDVSDNTSMFGSFFVLLASWALGGNLLLCALLYQNNLWTLINRGLMTISLLGIFQSIACLLPVGISGIRESWSFTDFWCVSYPFLNRYSQMSLLCFVVLLLLYNIQSLKAPTATDFHKAFSIWVPIMLFIVPYIVFLPSSLFFNQTRNATSVQEDAENLHLCTIVLVDPSYTDRYSGFRAVETVLGILIPYALVISLFIYLVLRINQRKVSKVEDATVMHKVNKVINVYQAEGVEMDTMSTATPSSLVAIHINGVANTVREETSSPVYTKESLAVRSDKQTEVVVYVISVCTLISFAPYIYQTICEVVEPRYVTTGNGLLRFIAHSLSYMVILVYPAVYTVQYPTIKESLVKLDMLDQK